MYTHTRMENRRGRIYLWTFYTHSTLLCLGGELERGARHIFSRLPSSCTNSRSFTLGATQHLYYYYYSGDGSVIHVRRGSNQRHLCVCVWGFPHHLQKVQKTFDCKCRRRPLSTWPVRVWRRPSNCASSSTVTFTLKRSTAAIPGRHSRLRRPPLPSLNSGRCLLIFSGENFFSFF